MNDYKELAVVKFGSSCLVQEGGDMQAAIDNYTDNLVELRGRYNLIVVSSGSVAIGKQRWDRYFDEPDEPIDQQVLASIGSAAINESWQVGFSRHGILAGQALVTHNEIEDSQEGPALDRALHKLLNHDIVPVVNENDLMSQEELKKIAWDGDNDGLARHLATKLSADILLLLTDKEGVEITDEAEIAGVDIENGIARVISTESVDLVQRYIYDSSDKMVSNGGMASKVEAAAKAACSDVRAFIGGASANYHAILNGYTGTRVIEPSQVLQ